MSLTQSMKILPLVRACSARICIRSCARNASHTTSSNSSILQTESGREEAVVLSNDSEMFVCWHPQPVIPYHCTQPLPEVVETDTVLNVQYDDEVKDLFKRRHPAFVSKKLQALTFTTKHRWFPKLDVYDGPKDPKDREYL